jgi:hypothetical protein
VVSTASKGIDSTLVVVSECEYNLNATGGATTITCTFSVSASIDCEFFEFTGTGSSFTFDKGANVDDSTSCTTCAAANLGPLGTSNNYILVQSAFGGATVTAIDQSYNISADVGDASAYKMNVSTAGTTPNWTQSASNKLAGGAIAIYEITGGAATPPQRTLVGAGT